MENLTQRQNQESGPFSPKLGHFFRFSKREGDASPLITSWTIASVTEYACP